MLLMAQNNQNSTYKKVGDNIGITFFFKFTLIHFLHYHLPILYAKTFITNMELTKQCTGCWSLDQCIAHTLEPQLNYA